MRWRWRHCVSWVIGQNRATWYFNACSTRSTCRRNNGACWTRLTANATSLNTRGEMDVDVDEQLVAAMLRVAREVAERVDRLMAP